MLKYGVIGTGHMGTYHVNVLSRMNSAQLIGIFDLDNKRCQETAERFNIQAFSDPQDLLSQVDAVSVCVPTQYHYEMAKLALENQKHVLVEKPICLDLKQAKDLVELAKDKNAVLHIGHVERFNGAVQELSNVVDQPIIWESRRMGPNPGRIKDSGVVMDLMIHDLDICMRMVNDKVIDVRANGTKLHGSQHEDAACAQLKFSNGCVASFSASRVTQEKFRTLNISQKNCYLSLDFTTQDLQIHRQANSQIQTSTEKIAYRQEALIERVFIHKDNPLQGEIQHFIDSINDKALSYDENLNDLELLRVALEIEKQASQ